MEVNNVVSQKTILFITIVGRTSDPTINGTFPYLYIQQYRNIVIHGEWILDSI
jgi:hypothetical protein